VTAEVDRGPDRSFSMVLWRVDASGAKAIADGIAYSSSPIVTGKKAYVQTGTIGGYAAPGRLRDDDVSITEVDLLTNTPRVVFHMRGQLAFPIGVEGSELFAYLIGPSGTAGDGGRLAAIDLRSRSIRDLGAVGTARDFSLTSALDGTPTLVHAGRDRENVPAIFATKLDGTTRLVARGSSPIVSSSGALLSTPIGSPDVTTWADDVWSIVRRGNDSELRGTVTIPLGRVRALGVVR
jgi:hypothetical protein